MNVGVTNIIERVKTTIDEIAANDAEWVETQDNTEMESIIVQKIPEAVDFVHRTAKYELLAGDVIRTAEGTADSTRPTLTVTGGILRFGKYARSTSSAKCGRRNDSLHAGGKMGNDKRL